MLKSDNKKLHHAFEFGIDDSLLIRRISGRRIHEPSGRTYHIEFHPPKVDNKDDVTVIPHQKSDLNQVTGEPLIQRSDDNEQALAKRLDSYHKNTTPVLSYYSKQGILRKLDASQKANTVYNTMKSIIAKCAAEEKKAKP